MTRAMTDRAGFGLRTPRRNNSTICYLKMKGRKSTPNKRQKGQASFLQSLCEFMEMTGQDKKKSSFPYNFQTFGVIGTYIFSLGVKLLVEKGWTTKK